MPSARFEMRLSEEDQAMLRRVKSLIAAQNPNWAKHGISTAGALRYCLMACDPENSDDS